MKLNVYNLEGQETGKKVELNKSVFGVEPNDHAIYLDVKQYLANNRQGTHKTKERAEITGSTRKIKRQKGTGTARLGSVKSPMLRGGGRAFGPRPRSYFFKLNKKQKQLARKSALTYKAQNKAIIVLDDIKLEHPKTKDFVSILTNLKLENKKLLFVLPEPNKNIYLSSRNLERTNIITASEIATYDIMNCSVLVFAEQSIEVLNKLLSN